MAGKVKNRCCAGNTSSRSCWRASFSPCNQATGINSIIAYNTNILLQSGLSDVAAHWGYVVFTIINFVVTFGGVMLVDRKGRKFLLGVGTAGIIVSMICTGIRVLEHREATRRFAQMRCKRMVAPDQTLHADIQSGCRGSDC